MKINKVNNDKLKLALQDRDIDIQNMIDYMQDIDIDDEQLEKVNKYMKLSQFQKDLLYLTTKHPVSQIANMYQVSTTHIYNTLKKINKILK